METVKLSSGQTIRMHSKEDCSGYCPVHNPSDHHMIDWPLYWRDDRRIFERFCKHGVGHPDPDSLAYLRSINKEDKGIHGCCGCCGGEGHGTPV